MAKITIHGYTNRYLFEVGVKVFKNGEYQGKVSARDTLMLNAMPGDNLHFKSWYRNARLALNDGVTDVYLRFDRMWGTLEAYPASKENMLLTKDYVESKNNTSNMYTIGCLVILLLLPLLLALLAR